MTYKELVARLCAIESEEKAIVTEAGELQRWMQARNTTGVGSFASDLLVSLICSANNERKRIRSARLRFEQMEQSAACDESLIKGLAAIEETLDNFKESLDTAKRNKLN